VLIGFISDEDCWDAVEHNLVLVLAMRPAVDASDRLGFHAMVISQSNEIT
jgi:hypothetical protein